MIWEIDGHEITVLIRERDTVEVLQWDDRRKALYMPVRIAKEEAIWIIRNILRDGGRVAVEPMDERLALFDRSWPLQRDMQANRPFIRGNIIHYKPVRKKISAQQLKNLKDILLEDAIIAWVGKWEDLLGGLLLPEVNFRNNKRYPYTLCEERNYIQFDRGLRRFAMENIEYCVFKALCDYFQPEERKVKALRDHYFFSWRTTEKIIAFEYGTE